MTDLSELRKIFGLAWPVGFSIVEDFGSDLGAYRISCDACGFVWHFNARREFWPADASGVLVAHRGTCERQND